MARRLYPPPPPFRLLDPRYGTIRAADGVIPLEGDEARLRAFGFQDVPQVPVAALPDAIIDAELPMESAPEALAPEESQPEVVVPEAPPASVPVPTPEGVSPPAPASSSPASSGKRGGRRRKADAEPGVAPQAPAGDDPQDGDAELGETTEPSSVPSSEEPASVVKPAAPAATPAATPENPT